MQGVFVESPPATILAEVEARTEQPVCNLFDFFAGTSSGGMLVLALNCPDASGYPRPLCSAAEVAGLFHEWGDRPFGSKVSKAGQPIGGMSSENRIARNTDALVQLLDLLAPSLALEDRFSSNP